MQLQLKPSRQKKYHFCSCFVIVFLLNVKHFPTLISWSSGSVLVQSGLKFRDAVTGKPRMPTGLPQLVKSVKQSLPSIYFKGLPINYWGLPWRKSLSASLTFKVVSQQVSLQNLDPNTGIGNHFCIFLQYFHGIRVRNSHKIDSNSIISDIFYDWSTKSSNIFQKAVKYEQKIAFA